MTAILTLDNIGSTLGADEVLTELSLHVNAHDICCLLGPSGCGKTTLLRTIAGFQPIHKGRIELCGERLSTAKSQVPPEKRGVGMVFQDYALFPHLTIAQNICFGIHHLGRRRQQEILAGLLELVQLQQVEKRYPHELSGGQCQRVALARALARKPRLLLLDEPFSNLDAELRQNLSIEVREILKQQGISAILVTHDQQEAFAFADHVGVLRQGKLQQWDTPYNLFHEPANRFVADFIGRGRFIAGTVKSSHTVDTELGLLTGNRAYALPANSAVEVLIRPDDIALANASDNPIIAQVDNRIFSGSTTLYTLRLASGTLVEALLPSHYDYAIGQPMAILPDVEHLIVFPVKPG